eukprot:TRINITY_DN650_c0_g1_i6.p1 TRINITY_DN650_c0_g1~~TRINITY_DN650_c0_g1_i6.p1  ORF type:complete len:230 (-),score=32.92 TRINITY_DN650_c0_g1_i6:217-906(-)
MVIITLLYTALFISGYASIGTEDKPANFPCKIDVGKNGCNGTLQVKNENHTLKVDIDASSLADCKPKISDLEVVLHSNSEYCEKLEFILDVNATANPNTIMYATVTPKDGTLPCPLIGYDIVCTGPYPGQMARCPPGNVCPYEALCDNDCFLGPLSWEECASQCLGSTGTAEIPNRGEYDGWNFQSRGSYANFAGNCCCKNIKNGAFQGNLTAQIFGGSNCVGSGGNSP